MRTVIALSGGLDSTVLAYYLRDRGDELIALSVYYGQPHLRELEIARQVARRLDALHVFVDVAGVGAVAVQPPHALAADQSMRHPAVPARNLMLLALATAVAVQRNADRVALAMTADDSLLYADCSEMFVAAAREAIKRADYAAIGLTAPFLDLDKSDIARIGLSLGVPLEQTWSCHEGGELHCGICDACCDRRAAFDALGEGVADPTEYAL